VEKELQNQYLKGSVESHEVVTVLVAMHKAERISKQDIKNILMTIFRTQEVVLKALDKASRLIDSEMIDSIIKDVETR
jgi:predicted sugar kinase